MDRHRATPEAVASDRPRRPPQRELHDTLPIDHDPSGGDRLPPALTSGLTATAFLLWLSGTLGLDFDLDRATGALGAGATAATLHGLLEWTAAVLAVTVSLFAASRLRGLPAGIQRPPEIVLLAAAMPIAALLDTGSALVAIGGPETGVDAHLASWTTSRSFLALALLVGGWIATGQQVRSWRVAVPIAALGVPAAAAAAALLATGEAPRLGALDSVVTRPWDLLPLMVFAAAGLLVLPALWRRRRSPISHALMLSCIPAVLSQLAAAFGDGRLYGSDFVLAHLLKLLAYLALLAGIARDYGISQRLELAAKLDYETAQRELSKQTEELERVDRELIVQESKRRRAEQSLRMLEKAVATMSIGVTIAGPDGAILYVNPADAQMHGYRSDQLLGRDAGIFAAEAEAPAAPAETLAGGAPWARETTHVTRDGRRFPVRLVSDAVVDADGRLLALVTSCEDITERRHVEQLKHDFISTVSHELRTPLTSIIASLGLLRSGRLAGDQDRLEELLEVADRNSNRLLQLINELLDLQKLAAGKIALRIEAVALGAALEDTLNGIRALADSRGVRLSLDLPRPGLAALADRQRLAQVLLNLVSNAIKFSPAGEPVAVGARPLAEDRVQLTVRDRGPGIPASFRARLFEKFTQSDSSPSRSSGGSGLGLSIAKQLVEAMNGTIAFETEEGAGTTFLVTLPRAPGETSGEA